MCEAVAVAGMLLSLYAGKKGALDITISTTCFGICIASDTHYPMRACATG